MPSPTKGPRLGGGPAHERLMLANLTTQLLEHRSITTTLTKAKRVQPLVDRVITFAKRGDLDSRRRVLAVLRVGTQHSKGVVHELFTEIAPVMAERQGGYTRITKIANRKGDNAPMAVIELVLEPLTAKQATVREAEAATRSATKKSAAKKATSSKASSADAEAEAEAKATEAETAELAGDADAAVEAAGQADAAAAAAEEAAPGSSDAKNAAAAADLAEEAATKAAKKA